MKKRILVCEFYEESNTFNPIIRDIDCFGTNREFEGASRLEKSFNGKTALHGGCTAITEADGEVVPTVFMFATSGGRASDQVLDHMCQRMEHYVKTEQFDGIYAALHGATCTENNDDACGFFLEKLRSLVGDKPIAASFDLHANITDKILRNAEVVCGYQTYPHIDLFDTGYRAAKHLMDILDGKRYYTAAVKLPMLVPPTGYTTREEPFKSLLEKAKGMIAEAKLTDASVFVVQPWLDISQVMSRTVAVSEDAEQAKSCALELARDLWNMKENMWPSLASVDEIIDAAEANATNKPVLLIDSADSTNGGALGDSPVVAQRLLERGSKLRVGMFIVDPSAVELAFQIGVGNKAEFSVGASFTKGLRPLKAEGLVRSLHDGWFRQEGKAGRGNAVCLGKTAVVRFGSIDMVICCRVSAPGDPQIFRHFGIEPTLCDLVAIKVNTSFREPYSSISDLVHFADTAGAGASNLKSLTWEKLPDGLYPFDEVPFPDKAELW